MSQKQYIKLVEKELQRVNKIIDAKIMEGRDYRKEARDHKLLLRKMRYVARRNFFRNLGTKFSIGFTLF